MEQEQELELMQQQLLEAWSKCERLKGEIKKRRSWSELEQGALVKQARERLKLIPGEYHGPKRGKRQTLRLWVERFKGRGRVGDTR